MILALVVWGLWNGPGNPGFWNNQDFMDWTMTAAKKKWRNQERLFLGHAKDLVFECAESSFFFEKNLRKGSAANMKQLFLEQQKQQELRKPEVKRRPLGLSNCQKLREPRKTCFSFWHLREVMMFFCCSDIGFQPVFMRGGDWMSTLFNATIFGYPPWDTTCEFQGETDVIGP